MRAGTLLLLAAPLLAGDADAVKKALGADRVAVAIRVEREFAMPRCVFFRGRFEAGKLAARMTIAGDLGEAEWGPRELKLTPGAFEEDGEPFEADWTGPSCGIGASLPALLGAVADGPVKGERLRELLKPLAPSFRIIHPVEAVDYGKASCDGKLTVEKGELTAFEMRLSLGGGWVYKVSGTVRAGADKAPDPEAWGPAPGPPDIEIDLTKIPEVPDDAVRKAIARGLAYLLSIQKEDGSWVSDQAAGVPYPSQRVPITAVCLHAAAACGADKRALERGLAALEGMRKRGVLEGAKPAHDTFDFSVWGSAFGLVHLDGALRHWPGKKPDAAALAKAYVDFAWRKQKPCGGWSYRAADKDGSQTILDAAHVEGLLLWKARGVDVDGARFARAVADLKGNRDRKGSFGYYHEGKYESTKGMGWTTPESIGRSVQGQLALVLAGAEPKESLVPHLRRFRDDYRHLLAQRGVYAHSPPYMIAGYYYHFGVLFAARALGLAPLPEDERKEIRRLLRHELLRTQAEDGSWVESPAGGEPYATAMALLALVELSR